MGSSTKTTSESKPPEWALPAFQQSGAEASRLYNEGAGGNTWLGSTVSPLSGTTMGGLNQLADAGANWDTSGSRQLYQGIGQAAAAPSSAETNLAGYASGANLSGEGNPFYRARLDSDLADTASQVRSSMSGAGRYGSDVSNETLADALGYQRNAALENDWNREQGNQFNAVNMIDQARQGNLGLAMGATQGISGLDQRNFENQITGAGATLQAGGQLDQQAQAYMQDEINKFYSLDNQDWSRLGMLQGAAAGAAGPYGTQLQTSRTSNPMAAVGALGSLAGGMKSDRRLKENIRAVGKLDNGHTVYAYNYIAGGPTVLGVMAQEVVETHPDAVVMEPDGFYAVNYDIAVKELETT